MSVEIRPMTMLDWPRIAAIYRMGIETEIATLEANVQPDAVFYASHLPSPRLVAVADGKVVGWIVLSPYSSRPVYRGVAEVSIYIDPAYQRQGIGRQLLMEMAKSSEMQGIWTLQASILKENEASQQLHASCGFRVVGVREMLGQDRDGQWHDIVLMERRNTIGKRQHVPQ